MVLADMVSPMALIHKQNLKKGQNNPVNQQSHTPMIQIPLQVFHMQGNQTIKQSINRIINKTNKINNKV